MLDNPFLKEYNVLNNKKLDKEWECVMTEAINQGVAGTQTGGAPVVDARPLENGPKSVDATMAVFGEVTGTYGSGAKNAHNVLVNTFWGNGGVTEFPCGIVNRGLPLRQLPEASSFQEYLNQQMGVEGGMEQTESPVELTEKMKKAQIATPPQEQKKVGFWGRWFHRGEKV